LDFQTYGEGPDLQDSRMDDSSLAETHVLQFVHITGHYSTKANQPHWPSSARQNK
jgi:hypothetical protein